MPAYQYTCTCGHSTEVLHAMTATVAIVCPTCLKEMTRKPQATTVTFKGSGFYTTSK